MTVTTGEVAAKDGAGSSFNFQNYAPGSAADALSAPVTPSTETKAQIGALTETAPASDTASSGLNGRLQRIAQRITSLIALLPTALGRTAAASSLAIVLSTEDKAALDALGTKLDTLNTSTDNIEAVAVDTTPVDITDAALGTSDLTYVHVTRSTSGETSAVSATSSQTTKVHRLVITAAGAVTVELLDGSAGTSLRKFVFPDAGGIVLDFSARPLAKTTANTALYVKTNAAVAVDVGIDYIKGA